MPAFADRDLEAELASGARRGPVAVVRQLFRFGEAPPYETLAATHGMAVPQLKSFVHRARARFRELLLARYDRCQAVTAIAEHTSQSVAAVAQALYRIRQRLLSCIQKTISLER